MDTAYLSVFAALAGSAIAGLTSIANAWLTQHAQATAQQHAQEQARREELYGQFIDEASKLFADALQHQTEEASAVVGLYALISRIRLRSSPQVTERAEQIAQLIVDTYLAPNKTFRELRDLLHSDVKDPFRAFSEACHKELRTMGSSRRFV
jgi:F0F1-type ATP synthase membrane subunit b/b'